MDEEHGTPLTELKMKASLQAIWALTDNIKALAVSKEGKVDANENSCC